MGFACWALAVRPGQGLALERHVPGDYATIQEAIEASEDGDEVVLSAGTYSGDGNRDLAFGGRAILVRSADPNDPNVVAATVIDCQGAEILPHRAFVFHGDEGPDSVVAGVTIRSAYAIDGGAMICTGAGPTVRACVFQGNGALFGGAIYNDGGSLRLIGCRFSDNASTSGGAVWNSSGAVRVEACTFEGNVAALGGGGAMVNVDAAGVEILDSRFSGNVSTFGGAMFNHLSPVALTDCEFSENVGGHGGGVYNLQCDPTLQGCRFTNNTAFWGAGVDNYDHSRATIIDCLFEGNEASWGGAMVDFGGASSTVVRCTFRLNRCVGPQGGAVCCGGQTAASVFEDCTFESNETLIGTGAAITIREGNRAEIRRCRIVGNTSDNSGGGLFVESSNPTVSNCIIAANHANALGGGVLCYGAGTTTVRNSLISGNTSDGTGAGVLCASDAELIVSNCTVVDNRSASQGGGLAVLGGAVEAVNSILWSNEAPQGAQVSAHASESPTSLGIAYCTIEGGVEQMDVGPNAVVEVGAGVSSDNPLFVDGDGADDDPATWEDNDYHLTGASPCGNAGDPNGDYTGQVDLDGQNRVNSGRVDIGADEYLLQVTCGSSEAALPLLVLLCGVEAVRRLVPGSSGRGRRG